MPVYQLHKHAWNWREGDLDLAEIAIEEEVTTDKAQLDTDTDELLDWVFGTELEDTASVEDGDELGNSSD